MPESTRANPIDVLDRLGLRANGGFSNAAVVLFGTQLFPQYPQCQLRMARFRGTAKTEFLDNLQVYGNSFQLLDEAMLFLQRHLPVAGRIQPGLFERVDEPLFPPVALREALVNGVALNLTTRQREILHLLAGDQLPLRDIMTGLTEPPAVATVRDDIYHLKHLGSVDSKGWGRSAVWFFSQTAE